MPTSWQAGNPEIGKYVKPEILIRPSEALVDPPARSLWEIKISLRDISMYDRDIEVAHLEGFMEKVTCMSGLTLLVLKELRLERGVQSAYIAEQVGKSPSAWAKIETGKSAFPMDSLFQVARALWVPASAIIGAAERYSTLLSQNGWGILYSSLSAEEDNLLIEAQRYYESPGFKRRFQPVLGAVGFNGFGVSVLNSPIYSYDGAINIIDVFRFVLDASFHDQQQAACL